MPQKANSASVAIVGTMLVFLMFIMLVAPFFAIGFAVYSCSDELTELKGQILEELNEKE